MKQLWSLPLRFFRSRSRQRPSPFDRVDFVIVDVETTGWAPEEAAITEIGAVLVSGGRVRAQFSSLVNPGSTIPGPVTELTGISDAMVAGARPLASVLAEFLAFAKGCVLTAHNAPFDIAFLTAACDACGLPWPEFRVLDTVELARRVLGEQEVADCKLATLADHFGARTKPRHRALPDALATADVMTALLRRLAATGVRTLAEAGIASAATSPAAAKSAAAGPAPTAALQVPAAGETPAGGPANASGNGHGPGAGHGGDQQPARDGRVAGEGLTAG